MCSFPFAGSATARAASIASLSGYVYLDANNNGKIDSGEFALRGSTVTLTRESDPSFSQVAYADALGYYAFDSIDASTYKGKYAVTLQAFLYAEDGIDSLGRVLAGDGTVTNSSVWGQAHNGPDDPLANSFTGITLLAGYAGEFYNFAKRSFPLDLVSKRMLMDQGGPKPVPEPATWAMLLVAGAAVAGARLYRRRSTGNRC
ncbi:MAG: SdrD B-like domain-containing protein [Planctomycetota bacterium]